MKLLHLLSLALVFLAAFNPLDAQESQPPAPVSVVIAPTQGQYRVLDLGRIAPGTNLSASDTLQGILNQMAAQGWKVVTATGSYLILSRGN